MSDVNYSMSMRVSKGFLDDLVSLSGGTATMDNSGMKSLVLTLSTNATSISTANLTSVGMAFLRNLNTSTLSTVTIGVDSSGFVGFSTLRSGEGGMIRLTGGVDYQAKGSVEGDRLRVDITEG
jgi:hypothetical protein